MRVLHVSQPVDAGVAACVAALAGDQVRRGFDVSVACPSFGPLPAELAELGVRHVAWQAGRSPGPAVPAEAARVRRAIAAVAPDLVHLHSSKAGLCGRLALRGRLPTVFQPNAWSFDAVTGVARTAAVAWERLGARWSDVIVCVSEAERARGEAVGVRARWRVVYNGVDLQALPRASDEERSAARSRLGLDGGPLVVAVGRLVRQKGHDVLLTAWPRVLASVPDAQLALVGDGPQREVLEAAATPRIVFAGERGDVPDWLAAADVVAQPSRWEGFSFVVAEALARGRSVVASDVAGAREAVGENAGAVVPVEDPGALADALVTRLLDPERTAAEGRAARERAERLLDVRRAADEIAALYADVLASRGRR